MGSITRKIRKTSKINISKTISNEIVDAINSSDLVSQIQSIVDKEYEIKKNKRNKRKKNK